MLRKGGRFRLQLLTFRQEYKDDFKHLRTYRDPETLLSFEHDVSYRSVGTKTFNPRIVMCRFGSTDEAKTLLEINDLSAEDCNLFHRYPDPHRSGGFVTQNTSRSFSNFGLAYSFNQLFFEDTYRLENPPIQILREVFNPKTRGTDTLPPYANENGVVTMKGNGGFKSLMLVLQLSEKHKSDAKSQGLKKFL